MSTVWKKRNLGYFYHFSVIILCMSNSVFLIYHIFDYDIYWDNTTNILLTIIGFLFAFAGINIYSIFNTNIVTEKEKLTDLSSKHKEQIARSRFDMDSSLLLMNIVSTGIMVSTAKQFNSQYIEQLRGIKKMLSQLKSKLVKLDKKGESSSEQFKDLMGKLLDVVRNLRNQLNYHKEMVTVHSRSSFFKRISEENREMALAHIDSLLTEIKCIEDYCAENEFSRKTIAENDSQRKNLWSTLKQLLSNFGL